MLCSLLMSLSSRAAPFASVQVTSWSSKLTRPKWSVFFVAESHCVYYILYIYILWYYTILYYMILYYIILYYTILYYIILYIHIYIYVYILENYRNAQPGNRQVCHDSPRPHNHGEIAGCHMICLLCSALSLPNWNVWDRHHPFLSAITRAWTSELWSGYYVIIACIHIYIILNYVYI